MWDVDTLFAIIKHVDTLILTGGEPALHPYRIKAITAIAKKRMVTIDNFYIATNGTISTDLFLSSVFELWQYCRSNIKSCLDISNDKFHDIDLIEENLKRLSVFSFTKLKFPRERGYSIYDYDLYNDMIGEGYGKRYTDRTLDSPNFKKQLESGAPAEIYLNSKGNIVFGCDWSYETQDKNYLCHVSDLQYYIDKIKDNNKNFKQAEKTNCESLRRINQDI
jgi:hypothetical protein